MTFFQKMINSKSVVTVWLISYLLTLMIPVILGIVIYSTVSVNYQNEVIKTNIAILKHAEITMDNILENSENIGIKISANKRIKDLLLYNGIPDTKYRYDVKTVTDDLKNFIISESYIQDMYIYLPNSDFVISTIGSMGRELAHEIFAKPSGISYDDWLDTMKNTKTAAYYSGSATDNYQPYIQYIRPITLAGIDTNRATLVINFNYSWFESMLKGMQNSEDDTVIMMDGAGNTVCASNTNITSSDIKENNVSLKGGSFNNIDIKGKNMAVSVLHSDITKWCYIFATPTERFLGNFRSLRQFLIISNAASLILGFMFVFYFTRRNYRNIFEVVKNISSKFDIEPDEDENEYGFITRAIDNTFRENITAKEKISEHNRFMKNYFFIKLLNGRITDYAFLENALGIYGIEFPSDNFFVIAIMNDKEVTEYDDGMELSNVQHNNLINFAIKNILEEMLGTHYFIEVVDMEDFSAALVCTHDDYSKNKLHDTVSEAKAILEKQLRLSLTFGISDMHSGYEGIRLAYEEALELIEYRTVMPYGNIIEKDDITVSHQRYIYPTDAEYKLINSIKVGDYSACRDALDNIFNKNFAADSLNINYKTAKLLFHELLNSVLKAVNDITSGSQNDADMLYDELIRLIEKSAEVKNMEHIKASLYEITERICSLCAVQTRTVANLGNNILKYIDEKHTDNLLCVKTISEEFGLTPNYLSRLFYEQTGERIPDYINKTRIKHAKIIMQTTGESISKIAESVGYVNSNVFIRTFKKYEGITPGIYQKHIVTDGNDK